MMGDQHLRASLAALLAALAAEEAHTNTVATDNLRGYCAEGKRLRDVVRQCRREAEAALAAEARPDERGAA